MALISYRFLKKLTVNLADEVFDVGDALLVRRDNRKERIALANIKKRELHSLYESAASHFNAAAAGQIWQYDRVFYALADRAAAF